MQQSISNFDKVTMKNGEYANVALLFTAQPPVVSENEGAEVIRRHYGIEGILTRLHGERDTNFLVTGGASKYILKLTNNEEPWGVTDFQTKALVFLEQRAPELPVPRLVRACSGDVTLQLSLGGNISAVRLLSYLEGTALKDLLPEQYPISRMGSALARLDLALAPFEHPNMKYALLWDSSCLDQLSELVQFIPEPGLSGLCQDIVDNFTVSVKPRLLGLPWQVIHNDLNLNNILIAHRPLDVSGIFDFGDIIYAPRVNELAVACSYHIRDATVFPRVLCELVSAYHATAPLMPDEVELLYDLIIARFATTILITFWRAAMFPENRGYIMRNNPSALNGLLLLKDVGKAEMFRLFCAACNLE